MILGKHAITYRNSKKLKKILLNFSKEKYAGKNMDFYTKRYSPEKVMKIFEKIIEKILQKMFGKIWRVKKSAYICKSKLNNK